MLGGVSFHGASRVGMRDLARAPGQAMRDRSKRKYCCIKRRARRKGREEKVEISSGFALISCISLLPQLELNHKRRWR